MHFYQHQTVQKTNLFLNFFRFKRNLDIKNLASILYINKQLALFVKNLGEK